MTTLVEGIAKAVARYLAEFLECEVQSRLTGKGSGFCKATVASRRGWALERPTKILAEYQGGRIPMEFFNLSNEIWCSQLLPESGLDDELCKPAGKGRPQ